LDFSATPPFFSPLATPAIFVNQNELGSASLYLTAKNFRLEGRNLAAK
jgi:hypothetical protein